MSDDSSLTITVEYSVMATREFDSDGVELTETRETDVSAEYDLTGEQLYSTFDVYRSGAHISADDLAAEVIPAIDDGEWQYHPQRADEQRRVITGRVDDWLAVAVTAADRRISVGSDDKVATEAAHIIMALAEDAAGRRPYLAVLDLMEQCDVSDIDRAEILTELGAGAAAEAVAEEAVGDD